MKWLLSLLPTRVGCLMAMMLLVSCATQNEISSPKQLSGAEFARDWRERNHIKDPSLNEEPHPVMGAVQKVLAVPTYPILLFFELLKGMNPV